MTNNKLKIAILGTRGIPNYHGGFEQFTEYFSVFLASLNHEVTVYNSSLHPYKEVNYKGVTIVHCTDYEDKIGTAGQFLYDLNCIRDARNRNFSIILQLGYTSSSIWHRFLPKESLILTNMDGLEWKRSKYSKPVQKFLKYAEKLAVKSSHNLIADSVGIQTYLKNRYQVESKFIAYGAEPFNDPDGSVLNEFSLKPFNYHMLIARMEPENNIEVILDGAAMDASNTPFIIIGKYDSNQFGKYLKHKYRDNPNIIFFGGIYNIETLNNLRYFSNLYFHGHSVGGTNPSLLEAMASKCLVVAHDNEFNRSILKENGFYFRTKDDVLGFLITCHKNDHHSKIDSCYNDIKELYNWETINRQYLSFIEECLKQKSQVK